MQFVLLKTISFPSVHMTCWLDLLHSFLRRDITSIEQWPVRGQSAPEAHQQPKSLSTPASLYWMPIDRRKNCLSGGMEGSFYEMDKRPNAFKCKSELKKGSSDICCHHCDQYLFRQFRCAHKGRPNTMKIQSMLSGQGAKQRQKLLAIPSRTGSVQTMYCQGLPSRTRC